MIRIATAALAFSLVACSAEPREEQDAVTTSSETGSKAAPPASSSPTPSTAAAVPATPALAIEGDGLRLFDRASGAARALSFGTDWQQVRTALAFRGPPGTGTNGECGAGPLDYASWPDGLTLYAQEGKFVGWAVDGRGEGAIATAANVGPGTTRAQLEEAYTASFSETTLGNEFAAGGFHGLLDGKGAGAKVTNLWAGVSCNFR